MDNLSLVTLGLAACIIALDFFDVELNPHVENLLTNKHVKIALGVMVAVAAYYHIETAVVLAAVLYVALNRKVDTEEVSSNTEDEILAPGSSTVLMPPDDEINNVGTPGMESMPNNDDFEDLLPTQVNNVPESTGPSREELFMNAPEEQLNVDMISGFGGNDMAPSL